MVSNYEAKQIPIKSYIKEKIRMLTKDFYLKLTDEEISHLKSLKREIDVDHYVHDLITNKLR